MTPAAEILLDEIRRGGPIPFSHFMATALYHPEHGYYRRGRDPFGRAGDFYTAEQVQPAFGRLIGARIEELWREMGEPREFAVVEPGPGRQEMRPYLERWSYVPVGIGEALPAAVQGVFFSNEFFDALPVDAVRITKDGPRLLRVGWNGERFVWVHGEPAHQEYVDRWCPEAQPGQQLEVASEAICWVERIAAHLARGFVVTIDYGYTRREATRHAQGTLMSYRRHRAVEDVLLDPGERDITAHVPFTVLEEHGALHGLERVRFESLAQTLLGAGESAVGDLARSHPLQVKTLVFGMGETFRTLVQRKRG